MPRVIPVEAAYAYNPAAALADRWVSVTSTSATPINVLDGYWIDIGWLHQGGYASEGKKRL